MQKIIWYFKQLLPLSYWTTYSRDGIKYYQIWRMWFGKCFDCVEFKI